MLELLFGGAEDEQGLQFSLHLNRNQWGGRLRLTLARPVFLMLQGRLRKDSDFPKEAVWFWWSCNRWRGSKFPLSVNMLLIHVHQDSYSEFTGACEVSSYKPLMPVLSSPLLNWLPQIPLTALKGKGEHGGNRQVFCSVRCLKASSLTPSHYEVSRTLCFLSYMAFSGSCAETWAGLGTSRGLLFCF